MTRRGPSCCNRYVSASTRSDYSYFQKISPSDPAFCCLCRPEFDYSSGNLPSPKRKNENSLPLAAPIHVFPCASETYLARTDKLCHSIIFLGQEVKPVGNFGRICRRGELPLRWYLVHPIRRTRVSWWCNVVEVAEWRYRISVCARWRRYTTWISLKKSGVWVTMNVLHKKEWQKSGKR